MNLFVFSGSFIFCLPFQHINQSAEITVIEPFTPDYLLFVQQINSRRTVNVILAVVVTGMVRVPGIGPVFQLVLFNKVG